MTEELWPGARVSRCSYVVSMLQPKIVSDLELERYGYRAIPLDPAYVSLTEQGPIFFFNEVENTAKSIARYSQHDAENYPKFEALMDRAARFVKPMMLREPPALGSKAPGDLAALLREAGRMAGFCQARRSTSWSASSRCRSATCSTTTSSSTGSRARPPRAASSASGPGRARRAPPTTSSTTRSASAAASRAPGAR